MNDAIGIGYFQFDNLVRNRVPFCLFSLQTSLESVYKGQELEHLNRYGEIAALDLSIEQILNTLEKKKWRPIDPVVLLCADGVRSKSLANSLGSKGFLNCYFVEGGSVQLVSSSHESGSF